MFAFRLSSFAGILALFAGVASATQTDPAVRNALRSRVVRGPLPVIINLKGRFDVQKLNGLTGSQLQRGRAIAAAMERFNLVASAPLRNFLATQDGVREVSPIWITNSVRVRAPKEVVAKLIAMNAAESIVLDEPRPVGEMLDTATASYAPHSYWDAPEVAWGVQKLDAPKIWETGNRGNGAIVAMIDSGANLKHPDLAPALWKNPGETGTDENGKDKATNGIDDDANGFIDDVVGWNFDAKTNNPTDDNGHGSQTAGIVGGRGTGGTQTGVAPGATLMILKSCCNSGGKVFESNTWEAIQYAIKNGAKVISMSLSAKPPSHPQYAKWRQVGEVELTAGIIHVNSAGNLGSGNEPHNMGAPATESAGVDTTTPRPTARNGGTSMIPIGATDKADKCATTRAPARSAGKRSRSTKTSRGRRRQEARPDQAGSLRPERGAEHVDGGRGLHERLRRHVERDPAHRGRRGAPRLREAEPHAGTGDRGAHVDGGRGGVAFNNHCGAGRVNASAAVEYVRTHFME